MQTSRSDAQRKLMRTLHFTEADLDANARGVMTKDQRKQLLHRVLRDFMLAITGIVGIYAASLAIALFRDGYVASKGLALLSQYAALACLFFTALSVLQWFKVQNTLKNTVESVEGVIELRKNRIGAPRYAVCIAEMEFVVSSDIYNAFQDAMPYRIYYAPGSDTILSAEWLRAE